jgi:hypothetical protein
MTGMGGYPLTFVKGLHGGGGEPDIELFSQQLIRDAVVVMVHLDVVVDINLRLEPLGVFVGTLRQRQGTGSIDSLKQLPADLPNRRRERVLRRSRHSRMVALSSSRLKKVR